MTCLEVTDLNCHSYTSLLSRGMRQAGAIYFHSLVIYIFHSSAPIRVHSKIDFKVGHCYSLDGKNRKDSGRLFYRMESARL